MFIIITLFLEFSRENQYTALGWDSSYLFRIDDDLALDATMMGSMAR